VTEDLTAKPGTPQADEVEAPPGTPQGEPTTEAEAPPGTEPGASPNPIPSLSQLAADWRAPDFLEQVLAGPEVPAAITEVEAKALNEPAVGPEAPPAPGPGPEAPPAPGPGPEAPPAPVPGPEAPPAAGPGPEAPPAAGPGPEAPPAAGRETLPTGPEAAATAVEVRHSAFKHTGDRWLEWFLPVLAIALPAFFLIIIPFVRKNIMTWGEVDLSAQRGDYLIPVLILCAETMRRWCREVQCRGRLLRTVRFAAVSVCAIALVVCFASAVVAVEFTPTSASNRSIVTITAWCLIPSFVFGTFAVMAPQRERSK
jgi:hypothetical protein